MFMFPYDTFTFKRMSFGLCSAQLHFNVACYPFLADMVEDSMEVFMDDLSVVVDTFEAC